MATKFHYFRWKKESMKGRGLGTSASHNKAGRPKFNFGDACVSCWVEMEGFVSVWRWRTAEERILLVFGIYSAQAFRNFSLSTRKGRISVLGGWPNLVLISAKYEEDDSSAMAKRSAADSKSSWLNTVSMVPPFVLVASSKLEYTSACTTNKIWL